MQSNLSEFVSSCRVCVKDLQFVSFFFVPLYRSMHFPATHLDAIGGRIPLLAVATNELDILLCVYVSQISLRNIQTNIFTGCQQKSSPTNEWQCNACIDREMEKWYLLCASNCIRHRKNLIALYIVNLNSTVILP